MASRTDDYSKGVGETKADELVADLNHPTLRMKSGLLLDLDGVIYQSGEAIGLLRPQAVRRDELAVTMTICPSFDRCPAAVVAVCKWPQRSGDTSGSEAEQP